MAFPTKTSSGGSGSRKLAAFKARAAARASPGESPSQYRAKVEAQRATSTTVSPTTSSQIKSQLMPGVKQPNLLETFVTQQKPVTQAQITNLFPGITKRDLIKEAIAAPSLKVPAKLTQAEINKIRSIQNQLPNFAGLPMSANMVAALRTDLDFRNQRINNREAELKRLNNQANLELTRLNTYNPLIKNGAFIGTDAQYKEYQKQYDKYVNASNNYNRNVEAHNLDVGEYNKNLQNVKKKTQPATPIRKVLSGYNRANTYVSKKLPTVKQAEPGIRFVIENSPLFSSLQITSTTRKEAEKIVQFNLGAYQSVKEKPLKAAANAALFFVGGMAIKGLAPAARALGAGAKTMKWAGRAEKGAVAVYALQSGRRVMLAKDAREFGYVTGDIILNEVLPAGLGLKYGVKVVSKLPKGAKLLKGTGTKAKAGVKEFARSEAAEVTLKRKPTKTQFEAEFNRLYNKASKEAKIKLKRDLSKTEIKNLKDSIRRNQNKQIEELALKSQKAKARQEDTLAKKISQQFQKERAQKAKVEFEQKTETLKGAAKEPTVTNISRQSENLVKKAIRLQEKYERGQISKTTYEKQKAGILKTAKEIENLKKYAIDIGVKPTTTPTQKTINSAMSNTKRLLSAKQKSIVLAGTRAGVKISPSAALGLATLPASLIESITSALVNGKPLPLAKIKAFEATLPARTALTRLGSKSVAKTTVKPKTSIKKVPAKTKKATKPRIPSTLAIVPPPKIPTISTTKKKKKVTKKRKISTAKQKNLNAVATFKDLIG